MSGVRWVECTMSCCVLARSDSICEGVVQGRCSACMFPSRMTNSALCYAATADWYDTQQASRICQHIAVTQTDELCGFRVAA
jgi:hypothetical protein